MKKITFLSAIVLVSFSACSFNGFFGEPTTIPSDIVIQKVDKDDLREVIKKEKMTFATEPIDVSFNAIGEGIAPTNAISHAQALTLAKRAAIADAYSQLAGKLYGVKINSQDTVKDAMLKDSTITTKVQGLVKNASIVSEEFKNGLYKVNMTLNINKDKWHEIFAY
ncbi:LPP20 family lipoprotein [Campylobacter pinnipediorum]|uniref:LPP20 family lipoprotein n=1 Tax=Campylobacter pinnipediorum TaxID=1965231 RepID=UPI00084D3E35|nr:LPP20 family lipoprotein [Campylobacter pinnipediorum]AQW82743.1 LPP20 family lipoprotein [Campylobacter pinnipediorum subsp. pinnipediorum]OPA78076.1 lipoprotein required for motility [Campylobacter pinnipediorum subsp. pinnipediorum]